jgi:hypothetical protein
MGITNSEIIKVGVDLLTGLLNTINSLTGIAGSEGLGGVITSILRLGTVLLGLKAGNAVFSSFTKNLKELSISKGKFQGLDLFGAIKATAKEGIGGIKEFIKTLSDPGLRGTLIDTLKGKFIGLWKNGIKPAGAAIIKFFKSFGIYIALALALVAAIKAIAEAFKAA